MTDAITTEIDQPRKHCSRCKEIKLVTDFPRCKSNWDGLHYLCRECVRESWLIRRERSSHITIEDAVNDAEVIKKFWLKVNKSEDCWLWTSTAYNGYGVFGWRSHYFRAARFAYILAYGMFDQDLFICHHCDNRLCVRPDHLYAGTQSQNIRDAYKRGRLKAPRICGEKQHSAKLNPDKVREIRRLYATGKFSTIKLGVMFGVSSVSISAVLHRKTWAQVED